MVDAYPPLCDIKGSYTAQFEHVSCPLSINLLCFASFQELTPLAIDYPAATQRKRGHQPR